MQGSVGGGGKSHGFAPGLTQPELHEGGLAAEEGVGLEQGRVDPAGPIPGGEVFEGPDPGLPQGATELLGGSVVRGVGQQDGGALGAVTADPVGCGNGRRAPYVG